MPSINVLDDSTISKIAAGEVVERPLSVVKELVENSIDAGSTEISIAVEEGGHRLIRVSDNGKGMGEKDAGLCVRSHTTSKLSTVDDLHRVLTLGFRGEALHSIGAVSRLTVTTSDGAGEVGWRVRMEGGRQHDVEPAPRVRGTTVEVEGLFNNVPARRKFQKSPRSEISAINTLVTKYTVGYPSIGFELTHNGRSMINVRPGDDMAGRIEYMMGKNITRELQHMTASMKNIGVDAWFSLPDLTFTNRKYQLFYVNKRSVKDRSMTVAVDTAYKGLIPAGRFGLAVIFLDISSDLVDVNVHPTKTEVRFSNSHDIHSIIYRTLRGRFVSPEEGDGGTKFSLLTQQTTARSSEPEGMMDMIGGRKKTPGVQREVDFGNEQPQRVDTPAAVARSDPSLEKDEPFSEPEHRTGKENEGATGGVEPGESRVSASRFTVLGQFFETFIMVQMDNSPVFIDQHVAGERIIYNQLRRRTLETHSQLLLLSEPVEVPRDVFETLSENVETAKKIGLEIEPFGDRAFVIRSVVHNSGPFDPVELLTAVAREIESASKGAPEDALLDRLLTVTACRMAVKAGQELTIEEMNALVEQLLREEYNRTCPHGRPIFYSITHEMLNSWFKR